MSFRVLFSACSLVEWVGTCFQTPFRLLFHCRLIEQIDMACALKHAPTRVNAAVSNRFAISILPKPFNLFATSWPRWTKATKTTKSLTGLTFLIAFWNSVFWSVFALSYLRAISVVSTSIQATFKTLQVNGAHFMCIQQDTAESDEICIFWLNWYSTSLYAENSWGTL